MNLSELRQAFPKLVKAVNNQAKIVTQLAIIVRILKSKNIVTDKEFQDELDKIAQERKKSIDASSIQSEETRTDGSSVKSG